MKKLSVIIIGYNSWHYLEKNLNSLNFLLNRPDVEVIYVDNASTDKTRLKIKQLYPSVILIENSKNRGISVARNQGIKRTSGEYIWLLDSDTEIDVLPITTMLSFMDEHPEVGICGCKLFGQNGVIQASCRKFPTISGKLKAALYILGKKINLPLYTSFHQQNTYNKYWETPFEVDYVIGACQLIRKSAQEKVGLLDENIFYGPEDADYCFRMKQAGYKVFYLPQVYFFHAYQQVSTYKIFSKLTREHLKGLLYYFWKHRNSSYD